MKRLGYRKSRNGCLRCKERRVKCDENKPCSACVRHGLPCSLGNAGTPTCSPLQVPASRVHRPAPIRRRASEQSSTSWSTQSTAGPVSDHHHHRHQQQQQQQQQQQIVSSPGEQKYSSPQPDPFPYFSKFLTDLNKSETAVGWISDLELMHHYTSVSYQAFTQSSAAQKTFQHDIPRESLSYPFLLHQILAFSAYHLAYLQPDCRHAYLMQAAQHQNDAIDGMRGTLVGIMTSTNCHAIFASSIFLNLSAFATYPSYEKYNPSFSPIDSMLDIFTLTNGMGVILRASDDDLLKGPLREMFMRNSEDTIPSVAGATLQQLYARLPRLGCRLAEIGHVENEGRYTINNAIIALGESIAKVNSFNALSASLEFRIVSLFPVLISGDYLDMLRRRHPAALAVLAHYCIIVHAAEPSCWFLHGWSGALISIVSEELLGTPWAELIMWPMEVIGASGYEAREDQLVSMAI